MEYSKKRGHSTAFQEYNLNCSRAGHESIHQRDKRCAERCYRRLRVRATEYEKAASRRRHMCTSVGTPTLYAKARGR